MEENTMEELAKWNAAIHFISYRYRIKYYEAALLLLVWMRGEKKKKSKLKK
jgi:hypothetical protein